MKVHNKKHRYTSNDSSCKLNAAFEHILSHYNPIYRTDHMCLIWSSSIVYLIDFKLVATYFFIERQQQHIMNPIKCDNRVQRGRSSVGIDI